MNTSGIRLTFLDQKSLMRSLWISAGMAAKNGSARRAHSPEYIPISALVNVNAAGVLSNLRFQGWIVYGRSPALVPRIGVPLTLI